MKRLMILAAASAALMTAACGTTAAPRAAATAGPVTWVEGANAQPLEAAKTECRAANLGVVRNDAFANCMATKGWTRS